jgi:hypothetical protein
MKALMAGAALILSCALAQAAGVSPVAAGARASLAVQSETRRHSERYRHYRCYNNVHYRDRAGRCQRIVERLCRTRKGATTVDKRWVMPTCDAIASSR